MGKFLDLVVVGGGQAGLATAHHAQRAGQRVFVLEAGQESVGAWPTYYESLVLFSPVRHSALPGMTMPGDPGRYPHRDEVVEYLRRYAAAQSLPVVLGQRVVDVRRVDGGFHIATATGEHHLARSVVDASGSHGAPHRPAFDGLESFTGQVLHSAEYKAPQEFAGRRVVVVGAGNSAVQIAVELAAVADVTLATRAPVRFARQRIAVRDIHDWLVGSGVDRLPLGHWFGLSRTVPVLDDGRYAAALAAGRPDRRPVFAAVRERGVTWSDGATEAVDVLLLATGFRPRPTHLSSLPGALDQHGAPVHRGGISAVAGLGFVGLEWQRGLASATLRGVGPDAARVVRALVQQRR